MGWEQPHFGPPHAASTGAYLEGFADALALARAVGDEARAAAYDRAVRRGLRSLRQLQFRDERDVFYISKKKRVMGALRAEVNDNAVRLDSAAHALIAAIKIMRPLEFGLEPCRRSRSMRPATVLRRKRGAAHSTAPDTFAGFSAPSSGNT